MSAEPHATHVLIRGHVFTYAEKAPFVASGVSVLGALEYDEATDKTKCHECGAWFGGMGTHIRAHGLKRAEYNQRHGLCRASALGGLGVRDKHRKAVSSRSTNALHSARSSARPRGSSRSMEEANEKARCAAQLLYRLQILAAQKGHTPRKIDLMEAGFSVHSLRESIWEYGEGNDFSWAGTKQVRS